MFKGKCSKFDAYPFRIITARGKGEEQMNEITGFSPEVREELGYYVYRLVDPRNGQTFYVGKGKNDRVFAHAKCALENHNDVDYDPEVDDERNLKYKTIREIKDAGLDVIYIIQKYGLSNREALVIESALIDAYSIEQLTNKIKGFSTSETVLCWGTRPSTDQ